MQYKFKQAVFFSIKEKDADGKDKVTFSKTYNLGVHDVPTDVEKHAFFLKMVKAGMIQEAESAPKPVPQESAEERSKRLHDKLVGESKDSQPKESDKKKKKG